MAFAYGMVMLQAFNGAGDTLTPTYVNLFGFWMLELPLAWWLAMHTSLKLNGVFLSVVIAQTAIVVVSIVLFRQGRLIAAAAHNLGRILRRLTGVGKPRALQGATGGLFGLPTHLLARRQIAPMRSADVLTRMVTADRTIRGPERDPTRGLS